MTRFLAYLDVEATAIKSDFLVRFGQFIPISVKSYVDFLSSEVRGYFRKKRLTVIADGCCPSQPTSIDKHLTLPFEYQLLPTTQTVDINRQREVCGRWHEQKASYYNPRKNNGWSTQF